MEIIAAEKEKVFLLRRWYEKNQVMVIMSFNNKEANIYISFPKKRWRKISDSADPKWMGCRSILPEIIEEEQNLTAKSLSFVLYEME